MASTSALVTVAFGGEASSQFLVVQYVSCAVVAIGFYAYTSWAYPIRPYFTAFVIGVLSNLIGLAGLLLMLRYVPWLRNAPWEPVVYLFDIFVFLVTVLLGVSLGSQAQ